MSRCQPDLERRQNRRDERYQLAQELKKLPKPPSLIRGGDSVFLSSPTAYPAYVRHQRTTRQEKQLEERNSRFYTKSLNMAMNMASSSSQQSGRPSSSTAGGRTFSSSNTNTNAAVEQGGGTTTAARNYVLREKQKQWMTLLQVARFIHLPLQASKIMAMVKLRKLFVPVIKRARQRIKQKRKMAWLLVASQWKMTKPTVDSLKKVCGFFKPWPNEILQDLLDTHLVPGSEQYGTSLVMSGSTVCDMFIADHSSDLGIFSAKQNNPWSAVETTMTKRVKPGDDREVSSAVLLGDLSIAAQFQKFKFSLELRVTGGGGGGGGSSSSSNIGGSSSYSRFNQNTNSSSASSGGSGGETAIRSTKNTSSSSSNLFSSSAATSNTTMYWRIPHAEVMRVFTEELTKQQQLEACRAARCEYLHLTAPLDPSRVLNCLENWEANWPSEFAARLSSLLQPRVFAAGTKLFEVSEPPREFIILVSGCVVVSTPNPHKSVLASDNKMYQTQHQENSMLPTNFTPSSPSATISASTSQDQFRRTSVSFMNNHNSSNQVNHLLPAALQQQQQQQDSSSSGFLGDSLFTTTHSKTNQQHQQQRQHRVTSVTSSPASHSNLVSPNSTTTTSFSHQKTSSSHHGTHVKSRNQQQQHHHHQQSSSSFNNNNNNISPFQPSVNSTKVEKLGPWSVLDLETLVCGLSKRRSSAICATTCECWVCDFPTLRRIFMVEFPGFTLTVRNSFQRVEAEKLLQTHQAELQILRKAHQLHVQQQQEKTPVSGQQQQHQQRASPSSSKSVSAITTATAISSPSSMMNKDKSLILTHQQQQQHQLYLQTQSLNRVNNVNELVRILGGGLSAAKIPVFKNLSDETLVACLKGATPHITLPGDSLAASFKNESSEVFNRPSFIVVVRGAIVVRTVKEVEKLALRGATISSSSASTDASGGDSSATGKNKQSTGRGGGKGHLEVLRDAMHENRDPCVFLPHIVEAPVLLSAYSAFVGAKSSAAVSLGAGGNNRIHVTAAESSCCYWWDIRLDSVQNALSNSEFEQAVSVVKQRTLARAPRLGMLVV